MKKYEKPMIEVINTTFEGIYNGSGEVQEYKCESIFLYGKLHVPNYENSTSYRYKDFFGCGGCPAYKGKNCVVKTLKRKSGELKPAWEREGHLPNESIYEE